MRTIYQRFLFKTNLLIVLFGLFAVACFGQNERLLECKEKEYSCQLSNYVSIVSSKCKAVSIAERYDCWIAEQTKIVEANPSDVAAYFNRGRTFFSNDIDRAILDFRKILELDPNYLLAYSMLGTAYIKKGEYDQALIVFNKSLELDPKYASSYAHRGRIYSQQKHFEQALAEYTKAIEFEPKYDGNYAGRARVYEDQQNFDKALADYNKAIELAPENWYNYNLRGYFFKKRGEKEKAEADLQKAKELRSQKRIRLRYGS